MPGSPAATVVVDDFRLDTVTHFFTDVLTRIVTFTAIGTIMVISTENGGSS